MTPLPRYTINSSLLAALLAAFSTTALPLTVGPAAEAAPTAADGKPSLYQRVKRSSLEVMMNDQLAGSGWIADASGLALTAAHVVGNPNRKIFVVSPVAGRVPAKLLAVDLGHDLALLQLPKRDGGYPALPFAKSMPGVGEKCFLYGAPMFRHHVMVSGTPAREGTAYEWINDHFIAAVHFAGPSPQGMSGGPWLNANGQVVGLQSAMITLNKAPMGIASVIPVSPVARLVKTRTHAATLSIGAPVEEIWEHGSKVTAKLPKDFTGVVVRNPPKSSPIGKAGVKEWHVIHAVDGQAVTHRDQFIRMIRSKTPGSDVKFSVYDTDKKKQHEITIKLKTLEATWDFPKNK